MSKYPIYIVDAFTKLPFKGNPAAVCLLEKPIEEYQMKKIAAEMNLSETSFVVYNSENYDNEPILIRWFTPTQEVPLCGHATLATSHVLFHEANFPLEKIRYDTLKVGPLAVTREIVDGKPFYEMDLPLGKPNIIELSDEIIDRVCKELNSINKENIEEVLLCKKTSKLLIVIKENVEEILNLKPSYTGLLDIDFGEYNEDVLGIIVSTSVYNQEDCDYSQYNCVSRYFAPWRGINEDPVTGSAHTVLANYWDNIFNNNNDDDNDDKSLFALQASERTGEIKIKLNRDTDRVIISGNASTVLKGTINAEFD
eukprot:TRINITY_DN4799_c0_g1_i1.p1 TRINITY_DN4799_c0_g1~~TRINITY_DN4799_c0_g1_i1.p1  ORF type:complete len:311 (-),score=91.07 TRINITY_DN4799_c0_g1_i1:6-938(-)